MLTTSTKQADLPLAFSGVGAPTTTPQDSSADQENKRLAKHHMRLAQSLDVAEYARVQRASRGEKVYLVAAYASEDPDRIPLLFRSVLDQETGWFIGILYMSASAAKTDGIADAVDREIYTLDQTYWMNAEWNTSSLRTVIAKLGERGVHLKVLDQFKSQTQH